MIREMSRRPSLKTCFACAAFAMIGSYILFSRYSFYSRLSDETGNKNPESQMHETLIKNFTGPGLPATEAAALVEPRFKTEGKIALDDREERMRNCSRGNELVGPLYVNKAPFDWDEIKEDYSFVKAGGFYSPTHCQPTVKVDDNLFNRGKLMNVGFRESLNYGDFSCFVFHDVDLIPEDDRNFYGCNISPAHMSVAVDKFNYKLFYDTLFGGVVMFTKGNFIAVNGFSNTFWGWGAEDDDLYRRIWKNGLVMKRPPIEIARYTMLKHKEQPKSDKRFQHFKDADGKERIDGLNSLNYSIKATTKHRFYTTISVDLLKKAKD